MQNNVKKFVLGLCFFGLFLALPASFSWGTDAYVVNCSKPTVSVTAQGAGYASFAVESAGSTYQYWYVNVEENANSSVYTASASNITISSLEPGTYKVYFCSVCGGQTSEYIIQEIIIE
jgi:hypothetical protein